MKSRKNTICCNHNYETNSDIKLNQIIKRNNQINNKIIQTNYLPYFPPIITNKKIEIFNQELRPTPMY